MRHSTLRMFSHARHSILTTVFSVAGALDAYLELRTRVRVHIHSLSSVAGLRDPKDYPNFTRLLGSALRALFSVGPLGTASVSCHQTWE